MSGQENLSNEQFGRILGTEVHNFSGLAKPHAQGGVDKQHHLAPWHKTQGYEVPGKGFLRHLRNEVNGMPWIGNN